MPRGQRLFMVPWGSVVGKTGLSADSVDEIMAAVKDDFEAWRAHKPASGNGPTLDEDTLAAYAKALHAVFTAKFQKTNEAGLESIATLISLQADFEKSTVDAITRDLRAVAKELPTVFSVSAGALPRIRRLASTKGKSTGLEAFVRAGRRAKKDETVDHVPDSEESVDLTDYQNVM